MTLIFISLLIWYIFNAGAYFAFSQVVGMPAVLAFIMPFVGVVVDMLGKGILRYPILRNLVIPALPAAVYFVFTHLTWR